MTTNKNYIQKADSSSKALGFLHCFHNHGKKHHTWPAVCARH